MIKEILETRIRNSLDEDTFDRYSKVLKDLLIIYDMPSWNLNLRSSVALRVTPTHHFVDTSIAITALWITSNDLNSYGLFFEDMAIRGLSVYAKSINETLKNYRDSLGHKVNVIFETRNGDYCAIETKIASEKNINEGINSLKNSKIYYLKAIIDFLNLG